MQPIPLTILNQAQIHNSAGGNNNNNNSNGGGGSIYHI